MLWRPPAISHLLLLLMGGYAGSEKKKRKGIYNNVSHMKGR